MTCLVLGILIAYFFAIPTAISLYTTVFLIAALAIIFYIFKRKQLKPIWFGFFSFLLIFSFDIFPSNFYEEEVKVEEQEIEEQDSEVAKTIIKNAKEYEGTSYKYGGITKEGMDCSGLVRTAFKKEDIILPRSSSAMAKTGDWIDLKEVKEGDLLFFSTKKNSQSVNHVGLVTYTTTEDIEFIHATTSKGVLISKLSEKYWHFAFKQARRVL